MRLSSGYENRKARVEMLPLIDIVFLLLVFFIYAMLSMVVHRGIKVELPGAATARLDKQDYVSITITKDNAVWLGEVPLGLDELPARVTELAARRGEMPVYINGDVRADLGIAVEVLDLLRQVGVEQVSFECMEPVE